ncbi:hypothetical protein [Streptomyces jumonjinensis]|uniref:hypothetical protein n=1 Tax=Streptomyces jumonjinensis TaxID=1945 RepID=UPI0037BB2830
MTVCAIESAAESTSVSGPGITITADGAYAARLAGEGEDLYPERWTLDGPEPYAVQLPLAQPEERGTDVLPLSDGRVLIRRSVAGRQLFSLVYPTGPGTGELPLGGIETASLVLLPPSPDGRRAYALVPGPRSTAVWLVVGGAFGPEHVAEVAGRCSGGVWLDRTGRMLALDREQGAGGPVKAVTVDLERGGETTALLQIAEGSDDRLLLADPDSGLLLIRSNAAGHDRLGWGIMGSTLPVRFPESLRLPDCAVRPFAVQPGQTLEPERCGVALWIEGAAGSTLGLWQPSGGRLRQLAAPRGWLAGTGVWDARGALRLPYVSGGRGECGLARLDAAGLFAREATARRNGAQGEQGAPAGETGPGRTRETGPGEPREARRPVPLQQAPLMGRKGLG